MEIEPDDTSAVTEPEYLALAADAAARAAMQGPVPVDPDVAEHMGAFEEDALSADDALDSLVDGLDPTAGEGVGHE